MQPESPSCRGRFVAFLREHAPLLGLGAAVAVTAVVLLHLDHESRALYRDLARQGAGLQASTIEEFRAAYTDVVDRLHEQGGAGDVPLPATLTLDLDQRLNRNRPGAHVRLYSDLPFPGRRGRRLDAFETDALRRL
ncbi:MAG TPA: hypothetical protein VFA26_12880, partial [Gemmataceae bacterium]|nr:hypothetical protein [Gemmataceae bacterium]